MNRQTYLQHRALNHLQSLLLGAGLAALLGYLAWVIGGQVLAVVSLVAVGLLYLVNPALSPRLVLRLYRGVALTPASAPALHRILGELAQRAGLREAPRLYAVPGPLMNAFTVGQREQAAIALSEGLLRGLDLHALAGVLAHEVAHVRNNDTRVMGFADLATRLTRALSLFGQLLVLFNLPMLLLTGAGLDWTPILVLVFAPLGSALIQLALSRNREYQADLAAAELLGDPRPLIAALAAMERSQGRVLEQMWPSRRGGEPSLLRTHPSSAARIARLRELHAPAAAPPLQLSVREGVPVRTLPRWRPLRAGYDYRHWF